MLALLTPPAVDAVSLQDVKDWARIDHTHEDAVLVTMTAAAIGFLDGQAGYLGRALITQTWRLALPFFPVCPAEIRVPLPPCQAVDSISYIDPTGVVQDYMGYRVYGLGVLDHAVIKPPSGQGWPGTRDDEPAAVTITFRAGFGDASTAVPQELRSAIAMHASHLFDNREAVAKGGYTAPPMGYDDLVGPYRLRVF